MVPYHHQFDVRNYSVKLINMQSLGTVLSKSKGIRIPLGIVYISDFYIFDSLISISVVSSAVEVVHFT